MRLNEIYKDNTPEYGWFQSNIGPNGILGVELLYLVPTEPRLQARIDQAKIDGDKKIVDKFETRKNNYSKQHKQFMSFSLGWWLSVEEFNNGRPNVKGITKGNVFQRFPMLKIFKSKKEAEQAAKI